MDIKINGFTVIASRKTMQNDRAGDQHIILGHRPDKYIGHEYVVALVQVRGDLSAATEWYSGNYATTLEAAIKHFRRRAYLTDSQPV